MTRVEQIENLLRACQLHLMVRPQMRDPRNDDLLVAEIRAALALRPETYRESQARLYRGEPAPPSPSPPEEPAPHREPCLTPTLKPAGPNGDESVSDHDAPEFCVCGVRMDRHAPPSPVGGVMDMVEVARRFAEYERNAPPSPSPPAPDNVPHVDFAVGHCCGALLGEPCRVYLVPPSPPEEKP